MSSRRGRILLGVGIVGLLVLLFSLRGIAGFYTDYLWFSSLDQTSVWRGMLGARTILALIFVLLFFGIAWVNLFVADRLAPPFRPAGPEDELLERYHELVAGRMGWVRIGLAGFLAFIAGLGASSEWNSWILFVNGGDFGIQDPQFGYDVGFFVFKLPFLSFIVDWLFASVLIILIITAVAHYLNGGIRVQTSGQRVTPQVKAHLSLLVAALSLIKAVDYWLQRFELTTSSRGVVDGAAYTDVNAQLPALNLLILISIAAATLFVVNIFRRGWTLPLVAVVLWGFVAVVAGGIYPALVQRFRVEPEEFARESEYIERNMEATRSAMGIDNVTRTSFFPQEDVDDVDLAPYADTIRNTRLWDPADLVSRNTFEQLQRIREYYQIADVDAGRYMIDDQLTAVGVGLRTVDRDGVPGDSWEIRNLAYTHGYGAVLAPSGATDQREPDFAVQNIPVQVDGSGLEMPQPRVYFGEDLDGYAVVDTGRDEIDFQDDEGTHSYRYTGEDGVEAGSLVRRLAFALRFGDINPLISNYMGGDTRMLYVRDVAERIHTMAPFLHADADPYPVLLEDRTVWVQDLYTTTSRFPYSQEADTDELPEDSGLRHDFNYVRNSVKAVVDAYDGTVDFYVVDDEDPIIDAYRDAFPDLFTDGQPESDGGEMPDELVAHLRYPEDLFRVQTTTWQRYHLEEPADFFSQQNAWQVAVDPGTAGGEGAVMVTDEEGQATGETVAARIPPYYQLLQLPGEEEIEFALLRPFVPRSEEDDRHQLTGIMAARMDPGHYGELITYEMPSDNLPGGPGIAATNIASDERVGRLQNLLGETGSRVLMGNLLVLPLGEELAEEGSDGPGEAEAAEDDAIDETDEEGTDGEGDADDGTEDEGAQAELSSQEDEEADEEARQRFGGSLIYVQPFYVEPEDVQRPRLNFVIVAFGEDVVIEPTLQEALQAMFGQDIRTAEDPESLGEDIDELIDEPGEEGEEGTDGEAPDETTTTEEPATTTEPDETEPPPAGSPQEQAQQLVEEADQLLVEAENALQEGDLGTYQERTDEAVARYAEAFELLLEDTAPA